MPRKTIIAVAVGFAVLAFVLYFTLQDRGQADAATAALMDESGQTLLTASPDEVLAAASREVGFAVRPINQKEYSLRSFVVSLHPPEIPGGLDSVSIRYDTDRTREKDGPGAVDVTQVNITLDSPIRTGYKEGEPPAEPVDLGLLGVRTVRVRFKDDQVGYTVWHNNYTSHVVFIGPQPSDEAVIDALKSIAK